MSRESPYIKTINSYKALDPNILCKHTTWNNRRGIPKNPSPTIHTQPSLMLELSKIRPWVKQLPQSWDLREMCLERARSGELRCSGRPSVPTAKVATLLTPGSCPRCKNEKEVITLKAKGNISFKEARKRLTITNPFVFTTKTNFVDGVRKGGAPHPALATAQPKPLAGPSLPRQTQQRLPCHLGKRAQRHFSRPPTRFPSAGRGL